MTKYIVDLSLDGYDSPEDAKKAEIEFINEQLNFSASYVKVTQLNDIKIPDCSDNSCYFKGRGSGGMRTNGGCRCLNNPDGRIYVRKLHDLYKG